MKSEEGSKKESHKILRMICLAWRSIKEKMKSVMTSNLGNWVVSLAEIQNTGKKVSLNGKSTKKL